MLMAVICDADPRIVGRFSATDHATPWKATGEDVPLSSGEWRFKVRAEFPARRGGLHQGNAVSLGRHRGYI